MISLEVNKSRPDTHRTIACMTASHCNKPVLQVRPEVLLGCCIEIKRDNWIVCA